MDDVEKKNKVILWGTGEYGKMALKSINKNKAEIIKVMDSSSTKIGMCWNGWVVENPNKFVKEKRVSFDYILLAIKNIGGIKDVLKDNGISIDSVVEFSLDGIEGIDWIDGSLLKEFLSGQSEYHAMIRQRNSIYENANHSDYIIRSSIECLKKILEDGCSLARFGDGEFEIMNDNFRPWFQEPDSNLAKKLVEVICYENQKFLIAIPDQFSSLESYTQETADGIRGYMVNARKHIERYLDKEKIYYDTYVSRPYLIYKKNNSIAGDIFEHWKKIWNSRNVLIIEGANVRNGVNNDLFEKASRIERIICPIKNAFGVYGKIIDFVSNNISKDNLILISLGPTATVLAYDLYKLGYQAIDIGQLDNEYEWFLKGAMERVHICGKAVPELGESDVIDEIDLGCYYDGIIKDFAKE